MPSRPGREPFGHLAYVAQTSLSLWPSVARAQDGPAQRGARLN